MKPRFNRITFTRGVGLVEQAHIYKQPILDLIWPPYCGPRFCAQIKASYGSTTRVW